MQMQEHVEEYVRMSLSAGMWPEKLFHMDELQPTAICALEIGIQGLAWLPLLTEDPQPSVA